VGSPIKHESDEGCQQYRWHPILTVTSKTKYMSDKIKSLFTNGKIIVLAYPWAAEDCAKVADYLKLYAKGILGKDAVFIITEGTLYPYLTIPENISKAELEKIAGQEYKIVHRAFESETLVLPRKQIKTIEHHFNDEELKELGMVVANAQKGKEDVEDEKKQIDKELKAKIDNFEAVVSANSTKIRHGYEERAVEVHVELNYETGEKVFKDATTDLEVRREPMDASDLQMKIDLSAKMFVEGQEEFIQHRLQVDAPGLMGAVLYNIKRSEDKGADFPFILSVNGSEYAYEKKTDRDADYRLATKVFVVEKELEEV